MSLFVICKLAVITIQESRRYHTGGRTVIIHANSKLTTICTVSLRMYDCMFPCWSTQELPTSNYITGALALPHYT